MSHNKLKFTALLLVLGILTATVKVEAETYESLPEDSSFKAYMDFNTITSVTSKQYQIQEMSSSNAKGLRLYNGRYTIAVGNYFDVSVGDYIDVTLSSGTVLKCIVGDIKQDVHTDAINLQAQSGNIVEFIVNSDLLPSSVTQMGSVEYAEGYFGSIESVTTYDCKDMADMQFDYITKDIEGTVKYLVSNKYEIEESGNTLHIIEYLTEFGTETMCVDRDVYSTLLPYYSYITP